MGVVNKFLQKKDFNCLKHNQWILFFWSPAICFVSTVFKIRLGNVNASWVIPFIMGLFAFLFPPFADFARTEDRIMQMLDLPLEEVIIINGDIIVTTCEYIFLKYKIPIELFRFIYTFVVYYFITKIFVDITRKYVLNSQKIFYIWIFLFMQIEFFAYIDNIRTIFVRLMLMYCIYEYYFNNNNKYRYYSLLLIFVHYAYFPILILFFFTKYINFSIPKGMRTSLVLMIFLSSILTDYIYIGDILSTINFGDTINSRIFAYTEGEWSATGESYNNRSFAFKIYSTLSKFSIYYLLYIYVNTKYKFKLDLFSVLLLMICLLTVSIPVLYGRYLGFFYIVVPLFVLYGYLQGSIKQKQMEIYIYLCMLTTVLNIYANWNCLVNGNVVYLLFPLPFALCQTYNFIEWRINHLADDFNKIINGGFLSR